MSSASSPVAEHSPWSPSHSETGSLGASYPQSSSTAAISSPLIQTPTETSAACPSRTHLKSDVEQIHQTIPEDELEAWFHEQASENAKATDLPENADRHAAYIQSPGSVEVCSPLVSCSITTGTVMKLVKPLEVIPRYFSLSSQASQVAFNEHLDQLLLSLLANPSYTHCSVEPRSRSSSISPLNQEASTPGEECSPIGVSSEHSRYTSPQAGTLSYGNRSAENSSQQVLDALISPTSPKLDHCSSVSSQYDFVYVHVDEHSDDSRFCNDSGSASDYSHSLASPDSPHSQMTFCHPSVYALPSTRTPLSVPQVVAVPQAPRKMHHLIHVPSSSPSRTPQQNQRSEEILLDRSTAPDPNTHCMQQTPDVQSTRGSGHSYKRKSSTPPDTCYAEGSPAKKQKVPTLRNQATKDTPRTTLASRFLAKEPASLRRAVSLRAGVSATKPSEQCPHMESPGHSRNSVRTVKSAILSSNVYPGALSHSPRPDNITCPPTQPSSPVPPPRYNGVTPSDSPLPLIAPPAYELIPRAPLTQVDRAIARIALLIKKDEQERRTDGLAPVILQSESHTAPWTEERTDSGSSERQTLPQRMNEANVSSGDEEDPQLKLGIKESSRMKTVQWMLDVMPPTFSSKPQLCSNLRAQLLESPDTRWHAAHMFTRYFLRMGTSSSASPVADEDKRKTTMNEKATSSTRILHGKEALSWDLAMASLAMAVKFHRDVLPPLYPVTASEVLILAPHTMEYDDLESAQRDLFSALSFCIGSNTPAAYMEEFWVALPSLRTLIESRGNWYVVKTEAWELLYDTLMDAAYLNYPTHVLTGCAVVLGSVESIVMKLKSDAADKLKSLAAGTVHRTKRHEAACNCHKVQKRARKLVRNVELDMKELLGISEDLWVKCMRWLETVMED